MARGLYLWLIVSVLLSVAGYADDPPADVAEAPAVQNVILYLAPGLGEHQYRLLEAVAKHQKRTPALARCARRLSLETSLLGSPIPDTPGGASTLATGRKCPPGLLSVSPEGEPLPTLLEAVRPSGRSIGLVTLGDLTHGAITAFAVHTSDPDDGEECARQLSEARFDLLVGRDREVFERARDATGSSLLAHMRQAGYAVVEGSRADFLRVKKTPLIAFFQHTFRADHRFYPDEPGLQQILFKAFSLLKENPRGFLLIVETPALDFSCRAGDTAGVASEMLALDRAVEAGLRFAEKTPGTLLVVASPHETGNVLTVDSELSRFLERFDSIRGSSFHAEAEMGDPASLADIMRTLRDIVGIQSLEQFEVNRVLEAAPGPERVRAVAQVISRSLRGVLILQNTPSGRSVPCFVHGPGAVRWPDTMKNSDLVPLVLQQLGLGGH